MNPHDQSARRLLFRPATIQRAVILAALGALIFGLGGCSSTTSLVKKSTPSRLASFLSPLSDNNPAPKKKKKIATPSSKYPPIPFDEDGPRVRRFIRDYAYKHRETMKRYLARAEEFLPMVTSVATEHGLPQDVSYLFMLESGANPEARSPANALGMWQFMPATARSYGLRVDSWVDERLDPQRSTTAAMLYLKDLYGMFGCWRLAFSAYNSGENKLNRVLCQEDADEYEEICSSRRLKKETREFWPKFQAIAQIAKNPKKFGFQPIKDQPYVANHEILEVKGIYPLKKLARHAAVSEREVKDLNPALVRGMTPPGDSPYQLRIPKGTKELVARALERSPSVKARKHIVHVVHRGDSVWKLMRRYSVSRTQLANLNPDVNLHRRLRKGDRIVIPVSDKPSKKSSRKQARISLLSR